jgi:hypothetical protein
MKESDQIKKDYHLEAWQDAKTIFTTDSSKTDKETNKYAKQIREKKEGL